MILSLKHRIKGTSFYFLCFLFYANITYSQSYPTDWWRSNGNLNTLAADEANNLLYMGGVFQGFYPQYLDQNGSFIDPVSGDADTSFANPNNYVYGSVSDGNGGVYIAGTFTKVGDSLRNYIAHIDSQGAVTGWNAHIDSSNSLTRVNALLVFGNSLYVGGVFSSVQGQTRYNLASFDKSTGTLLPWEPTNDYGVLSLAEYNGSIYAGGFGLFSSPMATASVGGAKLNPTTGAMENWYPNLNGGNIKTWAFSGDSVFIGGLFQSVSGQSRIGIACVSTVDATLKQWNPILEYSLATPYVSNIIVHDTTLYIAGGFDEINGDLNRKYLTAFNINTGNLVLNFTPQIDSYSATMLISNGALILGGTFLIVNNNLSPYLVKLDLATGSSINWDVGISSHVYTLSDMSSKIFVGGVQEISAIKHRTLLTAFDLSTGKPNQFKCFIPGDTIHKIVLKDSILFFGGTFTSVNGLNRSNLASYDVLNNTLTNWNPEVNGTVLTMTIIGNDLFVGGDFSEVSGVPRNNLASFDLSTGQLSAWNPDVNGPVHDISQVANYLAVGGNYNVIGTDSRSNISRFNLSSLTLDSWSPQPNGTVRTICESGSDVLLGGDFTYIDTIPRPYLALFTNSTGFLKPFDASPNGQINKIRLVNNHIYIAGAFTEIGGESHEQIAELNIDSLSISSWNPTSQFFYEAKDICVLNSAIYFAGDNDFYGVEENGFMSIQSPSLTASTLTLSVSAYSFPTNQGLCNGQVYLTAFGTPTFTFNIDSGTEIAASNGFISFDSLCEGLHTVAATDIYGNTIYSTFIIPETTSTILPATQNLSSVNDLLGQTSENCSLDYPTIDTIYIFSSNYSNDTVTIVWAIEDAGGINFNTANYYLDNYSANGVYFLQYNIFCSSTSEVFSVTQPYLFQNSSLEIIEENETDLNPISIFPNPTINDVSISTGNEISFLTIYNIYGQEVFNKKMNSTEIINLENFERGVYTFSFQTALGRYVKKVIKIE